MVLVAEPKSAHFFAYQWLFFCYLLGHYCEYNKHISILRTATDRRVPVITVQIDRLYLVTQR